MTELATLDAYGVLTEPATLKIQRLLPGPIDRVWAYLTDSELRRQWLAAGHMEMKVGAPFELVWRNDELSDPPGRRPEGFPEEQRMQSLITECDPPRKLAFTWQGSGEVSFELDPQGDEVLLTVIHRRLPDRATTADGRRRLAHAPGPAGRLRDGQGAGVLLGRLEPPADGIRPATAGLKARWETDMRKLIAGMKISVDGKMEGPEGTADWVEAWSDDYGVMPRVDACLLGGGMYPGYERYWTAIQQEPDKPVWITGSPPTPAELDYADFVARTPHYVLSSSLTSARWPRTSFVRGLEEIAALKQQAGKDIYLVGGARTTASLMDAGLVDELRLIVHPLIAGEGKALFAAAKRRRGFELRQVQQMPGERVSLIYGIG